MDGADRELRNLLSGLIARSGKSRYEVAVALGQLLGRSEDHKRAKFRVDEFCRLAGPGETRGARFPAYMVGPMCEAIGNDELARFILPERLQRILVVGELAIKSHGTLARALAELQKIVEPSAERKSGAIGRSAMRRK